MSICPTRGFGTKSEHFGTFSFETWSSRPVIYIGKQEENEILTWVMWHLLWSEEYRFLEPLWRNSADWSLKKCRYKDAASHYNYYTRLKPHNITCTQYRRVSPQFRFLSVVVVLAFFPLKVSACHLELNDIGQERQPFSLHQRIDCQWGQASPSPKDSAGSVTVAEAAWAMPWFSF